MDLKFGLKKQVEYSALVIENFHDEEAGAFFFTSENAEKLIARHKEFQDSSVPSGNSMMANGVVAIGSVFR